MWCHSGTCARPGVAGAVCEVGVPLSCQIGQACYQGTCQTVSYADVPVGGLCASSASCVAGATCTIESVCEATGDACAADSHCPEGQYCDATCLPKLELGVACDEISTAKPASAPTPAYVQSAIRVSNPDPGVGATVCASDAGQRLSLPWPHRGV